MKWSWFGRVAMALLSALALGLSMTACGGGTIAYMWVIGQQYNQIAGFKVDHYTGNLTQIPHSPFSSGGSNPVSMVVKSGGRYVYVINQGAGSTATSNAQDSNISVYAVGGEGTLTFQQSYPTEGFVHLWAAFDASGSNLFVLDKYSASGDGNGAITTYSADASTGRLQLVSQTSSTPSGGTAPTYLEVGANPLMMAASGSCLFTVNQADQSITPYQTANGQLTVATTGKFFPGTQHMTSINGNSGTTMVVTDAGPTPGKSNGTIFPYTLTAGCGLTPFTGGPVANDPTVTMPVYSLLDQQGKYLYVLNQSSLSTATTTPYSSITAYSIQGGELAPISGSPYKSGSGPVCMVEDPSQQFMYVSNHNDGTVSGYSFTATQGTLQDLSRGSTFTATGQAECMALSGSVD